MVRVALVVVAAVLALAAPAGASTIFFVRDGNIWAAAPDGSGQHAVTSDGSSSSPYLHVASAKRGAAPLLAFLRFQSGATARFVYGTMRPDGTGAAIDPASSTLPMGGFTQGDDHQVSIDAAGDRLAWTRATDIGNGETFSPHSVGVDGGSPLVVSRATGASTTTFGDPGGQTLLFDDTVGIDYSDANTSGSLWPPAPAACTAGAVSFGLVRQAPQPQQSNVAGPAPLAYYCSASLNLIAPALSPDGATIAAVASGNPAGAGRVVTIPIGGAAAGAADSPLTFVTPDGIAALAPDFAPDGSAIAFEDARSGGIDTVPAGGGQPSAVIPNAISPAWSPYTAPGGGATGGGHAPPPPALRAKRRVRAKHGIRLLITVTAPETVRFVLARRTRHGYRSVAHTSARLSRGTRRVSIRRIHGHRLAPGAYRVTVVAVSGAGASPPRRVRVTVTR